MVRGDGLVEVELVEDDDRPDAADGGTWSRRWAGRRRRAPLPSWAWSAVAGTMAVALAVTVVAQGVALVDRRQRLERVPGLVDSLAAPPRQVWTTSGGSPIGAVGDLVLVMSLTGELSALAWADGRVVWTAQTQDDWCQVLTRDDLALNPSALLDSVPRLPADDERVRVLCVGGSPSGTGEQRARALDPVTGAVLAEVRIDGGTGWPFVVDRDVVLVGTDDEAHLVARRWSPWTGTDVWQVRGAEPVTVAPAVVAQSDEVLQVLAGGAITDIDLATGALAAGRARPVTDEDPWWEPPVESCPVVELPGGATATTKERDGRLVVVVAEADGAPRHVIDGHTVALTVDDGSAPEVLLLGSSSSGSVRAVDARSGQELWSDVASWGGAALRVDGVVVVVGAGGVTARSAVDGTELWHVGEGTSTAPLIDGTVVATLEEEGTALVGRGLRDGTERWRLPLDARAWAVLRLDGDLLVLGESSTARLSPERRD